MLALTITAELNGVTDLVPHDTEDTPFPYTFLVSCTSCREQHPNPITFTRFSKIEVPGSRGTANLVWRCRSCKRQHSADIADAPAPLSESNLSDTRRGHVVIKIDCRGLDLVEFVPGQGEGKEEGEFLAKGAESGTKFSVPVSDVADGEWFDFDEKKGEEVSVKEIGWRIVKA